MDRRGPNDMWAMIDISLNATWFGMMGHLETGAFVDHVVVRGMKTRDQVDRILAAVARELEKTA